MFQPLAPDKDNFHPMYIQNQREYVSFIIFLEGRIRTSTKYLTHTTHDNIQAHHNQIMLTHKITSKMPFSRDETKIM